MVIKSDFDGRIVVLRKSDQKNNIVQFHSDIRSDKIEKLKKNSKAAMLFYDKEEKIQVRLKVECVINHDNDITKESWSKTQHIVENVIWLIMDLEQNLTLLLLG